MPDLLLTHGYFMFEDPKELQILKPYAPLGILYLCSHLARQGLRRRCVRHDVLVPAICCFTTLRTEKPSVLGVYANLMTRHNVVDILRVAREAGWQDRGRRSGTGRLRSGIPGSRRRLSLSSAKVNSPCRNSWRPFEPETPVPSTKVAGIAFLDDDGVMHQTPPRAQIRDLDAQPWPARDAIDIPRYVQTWKNAHGKGSVSFITARGCPYKCRWCSHQVFGMTHRRRNPVLVVDEVEWLLQRYSPDMAWVADDVFTIHHGWIRDYAAEMKRRGLRVPFECISRADRLNEEMLDLLAELGCFRIWIGSESGSQRILDAMERGVKVEQVQKAIELSRARGIQSGMFLMWGYEDEQLPDIEATIEHVKRSRPDIFFTTVAYPIKGTPYYERTRDRLVQLKAWSDSSDRELKIKGRHSRKFYDYADRLLRDEVALSNLANRNAAGLGRNSGLAVANSCQP